MGGLKDPTFLISKDEKYSEYRPILGLITTLQQLHGTYITDCKWSALTATIPQSNQAGSAPTNPAKHACTVCGKEDHLANKCPYRGKRNFNSNHRHFLPRVILLLPHLPDPLVCAGIIKHVVH